MFESWGSWTWVAVAWIELGLVYALYFAYLRWRARRAVREEEGS